MKGLIQSRYNSTPISFCITMQTPFIVLYQGANLTCITFVSTASTCYIVCYADFNTKIQ